MRLVSEQKNSPWILFDSHHSQNLTKEREFVRKNWFGSWEWHLLEQFDIKIAHDFPSISLKNCNVGEQQHLFKGCGLQSLTFFIYTFVSCSAYRHDISSMKAIKISMLKCQSVNAYYVQKEISIKIQKNWWPFRNTFTPFLIHAYISFFLAKPEDESFTDVIWSSIFLESADVELIEVYLFNSFWM